MTPGDRLREERDRLGLSQPTLARLVGASLTSQQGWERGVSQPNAAYLTSMAAVGVDVLYVLSGLRLSDEQLGLFSRAAQATLDADVTESERERLAQLNVEAMRMTLVPPISAEEVDLVRRHRRLGPEGRVAVERMLEALGAAPASSAQSPSTKKRSKVTVHGDVGQQITSKGDVHNYSPINVGNVGKRPK